MFFGIISGGIIFLILFWSLAKISSLPKEKCPKCGKDIYPIELENEIYRECSCEKKNEESKSD